MSLTIAFAVLAAGLAVFFLVLALVIQNYLSGQPASLLPVRAVIAGALVAAYLVWWTGINTRAAVKDQYGTLFEFRSTATTPVESFTAIRKYQVPAADGKTERKVKFTNSPQGFIEAPDVTKKFRLNDSNYLVTAVEVAEGDKTTRFDAELFVTEDGKTRPAKDDDKDPKYAPGAIRVFRDKESGKYIEFSDLGTPGPVNTPSRGGWFLAVLINLGHFLIWLIAFWPVLRFSFGMSLGLAIGFAAASMFFLMPVLFDKCRPQNPVAFRSEPCLRANAV